MDIELMKQGGELLLLGMGIVFGFLTVLVFSLRAMSFVAGRLYTPPALSDDQLAPIDVSDHRQLIAVIAAAVARYRATRIG